MAATGHAERGISLPHSCNYCSTLKLHLFDRPAELRSETPIWDRPNPSQDWLASILYGDDFWSREWASYRETFYSATHGISFFDNRSVIKGIEDGRCLLAQRFLRCLREDEVPENFCTGARILTAYSLELGIFDTENLRWEMLLGGEDDEEPDNVYTILTEKGDSAIDVVDNHPINIRPGSAQTLADARGWLRDCQETHHACEKPSPVFTPTRLLEIDYQGDRYHCRLRERPFRHTEPYAALSYCWGGDQTFKTTVETRSRYLEEVDATQLPQTLRDAIYVTRQLGLKYIWIDALCIIQDSTADKDFEIGQMAQVYANATITIAATRARAVWEGFLADRTALGVCSSGKVFSLPCQFTGKELGTVTLVPFTFENTDPLDTRGWTFQERVLSPRVLDFGSLRSQYTCQKAVGAYTPSDGWSNYPLDRAYGPGLDSRVITNLLFGAYPPDEMLTFWMKIVQGFTGRGLTVLGDKLPAIAGMAETFGVYLQDEYCAGIWRRGMPRSLLWTAGTRMQHIAGYLAPRATMEETSAPSWSWAAVQSSVEFPIISTMESDISFDAEIEDIFIELTDDRTPYGSVKNAKLTIKAHARAAAWVRQSIFGSGNELLAVDSGIPEHPEALHLGFRAGKGTGISFVPDTLEPEFQDDPSYSLGVCLLLFGISQPPRGSGIFPTFSGLVVRNARSHTGSFSRVGVFQKTLAWHDFDNYLTWFQQEEKKSFVLV